MANENIENLNSPNEEHNIADVSDIEDVVALKEEYQKLADKSTKVFDSNRQLFERAKKAEAARKDLEGKIPKPEEHKPEPVKSNEPDYAKLAFLNSKGYDHSDDQKLIQDEAERLKLSLTDVIGMEHIQSKLTANKEARVASEGMPKGKGRSGGNTPSDVDYHLAKGTTPDDQELAEKVVNARMKKEQSKNTFSDELF
mgnify:FL=1